MSNEYYPHPTGTEGVAYKYVIESHPQDDRKFPATCARCSKQISLSDAIEDEADFVGAVCLPCAVAVGLRQAPKGTR